MPRTFNNERTTMNKETSKKEYFSPEMDVVTLSHQANLLNGSDYDGEFAAAPGRSETGIG